MKAMTKDKFSGLGFAMLSCTKLRVNSDLLTTAHFMPAKLLKGRSFTEVQLSDFF